MSKQIVKEFNISQFKKVTNVENAIFIFTFT